MSITWIRVLVDDAAMPRASDLPDDLKLLVRRNAVEVSHTRFSADSERLIARWNGYLRKPRNVSTKKQQVAKTQSNMQKSRRIPRISCGSARG